MKPAADVPDVDFEHIAPGEVLVTEYAKPANFRSLASGVCNQATRDFLKHPSLETLLFILGPGYTMWMILADREPEPYRLLANLKTAREVLSKKGKQHDRQP